MLEKLNSFLFPINITAHTIYYGEEILDHRKKRPTYLRERVAREAATLLYTSQEKEYKQAKERAVKTLGLRVLPSNLEVAKEIDKIANVAEGSSRRELLLRMRKEALQTMKVLKEFHPKLIGSVWRGTAHRNSDIDIVVFTSNTKAVLNLLPNNFKIFKTEWRSVTKEGKPENSFHIICTLPSGNKAEVIVRSPENLGLSPKCEIYGDFVTGLDYPQLQKVLKEDPFQRFTPKPWP